MTRTLSVALGLVSILVACGGTSPGGGGVGGSGGGNASCFSLDTTSCDCSTTPTGVSTGGTCPPSTMANAFCCGDLQWPGSGLSCSCEPYQCKQTSTDGSCVCGYGTTGPGTTCGAAGLTCCQHPHGTCECGPSLVCDTNALDVKVAQCSKDVAQCRSSSQKVFARCQ